MSKERQQKRNNESRQGLESEPDGPLRTGAGLDKSNPAEFHLTRKRPRAWLVLAVIAVLAVVAGAVYVA